ncbi:MAG TPA: pantoate--beta-alanine ligase [Actinomycetota bacterium]|nr:pantoate--beta-alanine ligase [Actinomycetota bacterium]
MELARSIAHLRPLLPRDRSIGLVPTMGALHDGHLSLVRLARERDDVLVMSIFVNPTQFGPTEDFASYPRDEKRDLELAEEAGVDVVFLPEVEEMYPQGATTHISVGTLSTVLEGADRPGHFDGVCTIVGKLFNIVAPTHAYFGQKDAQQVAVIKKMVMDLDFPIEIVVAPTVRERNGLALSSRNEYLTADERVRATAIYRALEAGRDALKAHGTEAAEKVMWELLVAHDVQPSYAHVIDPNTLAPAGEHGPALLVIAARVGKTRLIDNLLIGQEER